MLKSGGRGTPYRFMITLKNGPNKSAGVTPTVELLSDGTSSRTSQDKVLVVNAAFKRLTVFSTPTGDTKTKIDFTFEPTSNIQKEKTLIIKKLAGSKTPDGPLQITNTCAKNFEDEKGQWIKEAGTLTLKISTEAGLSSDKECPISITLDLGEGAGTVKPTIQIGEDGTAQQFIGEVNLEKTETPASSSGPSGPAKVVTTAAPSSGPSGASKTETSDTSSGPSGPAIFSNNSSSVERTNRSIKNRNIRYVFRTFRTSKK